MYTLWVDSVTPLQFDPEFDIQNRTKKNQSEHRTRSGKQFTYKWGSVYAFKFGVKFVDSSFASTVNAWWLDNRNLYFTEENSGVVYFVRIMNQSVPIKEYIMPYDTFYSGVIELESYSSDTLCVNTAVPSGDYGSIADAVSVSFDMGSIVDIATNCEIDYGVLV